MKISQLQKILKQAKGQFGDVDILLSDDESGRYVALKQAVKLHPYTGQYGCLNRNEPVNAIHLSRFENNAADLVLK